MAKSTKISAQERQWRAEEDLRTLTRASEITSDRSRMADVRKIATQQVKTLSKVAGKTGKPAASKKR